MFFTRIDDISLGVGTGVDVTKETGKDVDSGSNVCCSAASDICTMDSIPRPKFLEYRIILKEMEKNYKRRHDQQNVFLYLCILLHSCGTRRRT